MFWKKKKEVIKKHVNNEVKEVFEIPQIPDDSVGLRTYRPQFTKTDAVSPMEGPYTKDVVVIPDVDNDVNVELTYDSFRVEKKLTKEDEIRIYGKAYHEFQSVDELLGETEYKPQHSNNHVAPNQVGINFGIVYDGGETVSKPQETFNDDPTIPNIPNIHFGESTEIRKVPNIEFKPINVDNEIKEEQDSMFAKPTPKPFVMPQVNNPVIEDDMPKTIIYTKPKHIEVNPVESTVSIPDFVTQKPVAEEIRFYDSPAVVPNPTLNSNSQVEVGEKRVIYANKYADYKFPPLSLLNPVNSDSIEEPEWIQEKIDSINETLRHFGVDGEVVNYTYGPTVTRYEVKLKAGVNVKRITSITDNIKMGLCAKSLRMEAPIPGKSNVGIEVPNPKVRTVAFAELAGHEKFLNDKDRYSIVLGININAEPVYTSVAKMPHGLIAGTTGSGKSVCLNGILISLLMRNSPDDLKLILVDPKIVEFGDYQDLPHLATPVITNVKMASEALKWAANEMDRRFLTFQAAHARDIKSYNEKIKNDPSQKNLPRLVIVIEEFADLIMTCGNDVEDSIQRITQMGRAAGIHLILATQRPTTDIVKGSIKTNIQCRIAFRVVDHTASTTILGNAGAEELLGRGDMLFKIEDLPERIQAAFISDEEISRVCDYIRDNYKPDYLFTHEDLQNAIKDQYNGANSKTIEEPKILYEVATFVIERGSCSINSIQNTFSFGFNKAQEIVKVLEQMGIVSQGRGTTGREILVTQAEVDQMFRMGS